MKLAKLQNKLNKLYGTVNAVESDGVRTLTGTLDKWSDVVAACYLAVDKKRFHVVNDIICGERPSPMRVPLACDSSLDGKEFDVVVIGGGISGASIARELMKWKLSVLLCEKESDLALGASGRNDGEVHPGVDLGRGSLKQKYVIKGNEMYDRICGELSVPFKRVGQYAGFTQGLLRPFVWLFTMQRRFVCGVKGAKIVGRKELLAAEPNYNPDFRYAIYTPTAGTVCPYGLTIAYAENAVSNGAKVSLETAVLDMTVENGTITSITTNRGVVRPRLVINAAGVFAEEIAKMADDRFYSIHPRKGTNSILDRKSAYLTSSIASIKKLSLHKSHTKGGGLIHTAHDNILVGPDAQETIEREDYSTVQSSIDAVFAKQQQTAPLLSQRDIITAFAGVRAATFEEDFVIERGRKTKNLIHCAGIQSPGLTTAPAVAEDVAAMAADMLNAEPNKDFNPHRKGIPALRDMPREQRDALIKTNPDYGVIVCRCEEISRGEIIDALNSPICVPTVDGIKKRVRPGMGRCQGGFCMPLVASIISERTGIPIEKINRNSDRSPILTSKTKETV